MELKPLSVLKERQLDTIPVHFSKTVVPGRSNEYEMRQIASWITNRLEGRFSIVSYPSIDGEDKLKNTTYVAFEEQKELTYFMLACPYLRRN